MLRGWHNSVRIGRHNSRTRAKVKTYLREMSRFLLVSWLLISARKSSVTLLTPDPAQANTHPKIKIDNSELPLVQSPKLLGVYLDTFFSSNKHCVQVANRTSKRNTSWRYWQAPTGDSKRGLYWWHINHYEDRLQTMMYLSVAQMLANITWERYSAHKTNH